MGLRKKERLQKLPKLNLKEKKKCCAIGSLKIIVIILGLIAAVFLLARFADSVNNVDSRLYAVSEILKKNVELSHQLLQQQIRIKEFFEKNQLIEYIKIKMRPIQERVASLITQTAQYEKLPHIPGGPKHFITSTLKELDSIEDKYLVEIGVEVMKSLRIRTMKAQDLETKSKKVFETSLAVLGSISNDVMLEFLHQERIFLVPLDDIMNVSLENFEYSDIVEAHLELAKLFQVYEECLLLISDYVQENYPLHPEFWGNWDPADFADDHELQDMLSVYYEEKRKIRMAVELNGEKYPLLLVHSFQLIQLSKELISNLVSYGQSMRAPYIKLHGLILTDIKKLRIRVNNLRFNYAKKPYND